MDQKIGVEIIERACRYPAKIIANNAGVEGSVIVGDVLKNSTYEIGYNAQTGEYVNMIEKGIMDPTKVVKTALTDAFSVSGLLMTTEAMIADSDDDKGPPGMGGMGGMSGMGGMGGMGM